MKNIADLVHQGRSAMWTMSRVEVAIFIAVVVVMVALTAWWMVL